MGTRGWRWEGGELLINGGRVSVWEGEKSLEIDGGNGYATL